MREEINKITIDRAANGYQVYLNLEIYPSGSVLRPVPYVFESMESLLKFVEEQFNKR
jgi:hypothetical protein